MSQHGPEGLRSATAARGELPSDPGGPSGNGELSSNNGLAEQPDAEIIAGSPGGGGASAGFLQTYMPPALRRS